MDDSESLDPLHDWLDEKDSFYDANDVPSWRRLATAGELFTDHINSVISRGANPSSDDIKSLVASSLMLAESTTHKQLAVKGFAIALNELESLASDLPTAAPRINSAIYCFMAAAQMVIAGNAVDRHKNFARKFGPIAKTNAEAEQRRELAQTIAAELWEADADSEFRLLDMAEVVRRELARKGFADLPKADRIKEWIKPVAPDYARKGGRRRKTS